MGLASFPVAELTNIDIANVDTAAKAIAENADIAIGAKVRMAADREIPTDGHRRPGRWPTLSLSHWVRSRRSSALPARTIHQWAA
jgi:hypothetical protein